MRSRGVVGAYASWADATYLASELYRCPNVRTEDGAVYVNAGPERAFRAPGFPQCAWALEQTIDTIAAKLGIDPVEFRLKNMPEASQLRKNMPYTSNGLPRCLAEGARALAGRRRGNSRRATARSREASAWPPASGGGRANRSRR